MKTTAHKNTDADADQQSLVAYRARMYSAVSESHYGMAAKIRAERIRQVLQLCYRTDQIFLTYRKTFISIKVAKPFVIADRKSLREMERQWDSQGVSKVDTPQGIIYRLK